MLGLTRDFVQNLVIPLPPFPEQRRIVATLREKLTAVEQARAAAEAQLAAADRLRAAYLEQVFSGPDAEGWEEVAIKDVAKTSSGTTPSRSERDYYGGNIPWIKTGELLDGYIDSAEEHVSERALQENSLKLLPPGTLLVAMYGQGQTRGRTGLLRIVATTNQACFAILPNPAKFEPLFLQYWFRQNYQHLRSESEARGGNQSNLNGDILRDQRVPLPSLDEQGHIVAKLDARLAAVDELRSKLQAQLATIKQLPTVYLRQAFRGEL